jgi:hypothetical protein
MDRKHIAAADGLNGEGFPRSACRTGIAGVGPPVLVSRPRQDEQLAVEAHGDGPSRRHHDLQCVPIGGINRLAVGCRFGRESPSRRMLLRS